MDGRYEARQSQFRAGRWETVRISEENPGSWDRLAITDLDQWQAIAIAQILTAPGTGLATPIPEPVPESVQAAYVQAEYDLMWLAAHSALKVAAQFLASLRDAAQQPGEAGP